MKDKFFLALLFLVFFLALFLRVWQLDKIPPGLYPDEAINGLDALNNPGKVFYPENNGREGLFHNLIALNFSIFGLSVWSLRLVSAVIGALTIIILYLFTKELLKTLSSKPNFLSSRLAHQLIPLLASFFLAVSFWHINFSRIGFRAILLPFILTLSFYFLLKGFRRKKIFDFILAGFIFGLGFYTYISFRLSALILPFVFLSYFFIFRKENNLKQFFYFSLWFFAFIFITSLPIGLYFLENPGYFIARAGGISIFAKEDLLKAFGESFIKHLAMFNISGDFNWRHNFSGSPQLLFPLGILFLIGLILSIKNCFLFTLKKNWELVSPSWLLLSWFFVMLLPGILTYEGIPHSLRTIGSIPPVYIFSALGGFWLYSFFEKRIKKEYKILLFLAVLISLFGILFFQYNKYFNLWAKNYHTKEAFSQGLVEMGNYLNSLPENIEKYIIVNQPGVPVPYPDGIPMPAQTIMFIEATEGKQDTTQYLLPEEIEKIKIKKEAVILIMREDVDIFMKLFATLPKGQLRKEKNFWLYKASPLL